MAAAPNRFVSKASTAVLTTPTWVLSLMMVLTTAQAMAQKEAVYPSPPPPPLTPTREKPTWPTSENGELTTDAATVGKKGGLLSDWPWWWWIPATGGIVFLLVLIITLCACVCCKRKRRSSQNAEEGSADFQTPPSNFRRMNSSAAKRYLYNIASIFSWGSDFEFEGTRARPASNVVYANSTQNNVIYANAQTLCIPKMEPSSSHTRKSGQHYHNLE